MTGGELERARELYAQRAWEAAYDSLARIGRAAPLAPEDLELFATVAYMLGRDDEQLTALERAHQGYLDHDDRPRAVRCAFWLGVHLLLRREMAPGMGWFRRAQRLLDQERSDCVEHGYLLFAADVQHRVAGDLVAALAAAAGAAQIAERFGDANLLALALAEQGQLLIRQGHVGRGLGKLDEAMVEATAAGLSPIVTGLVYCSVIDGCQEVHELRRANEWTAALTRWCDGQPGLVPFTGTCLLHRAELLQLRGEWPAALEEARLAGERLAQRSNDAAAGQASYRQGELLRVQGELAEAERAYRDASRRGCEVQPGLALLRLAQGQTDAAAAAIAQAVAGAADRVERARLLPACVEIMLAHGDREQARSACGRARRNRGAPRHSRICARKRRRRAEPSTWPTTTPAARCSGSGRHGSSGRRSRRRTRPRKPASSLRRPAAPWETPKPLHSSWRRPAPSSSSWGRRRISHDVDSLAGRAAAGETGGLTARELQVLRLRRRRPEQQGDRGRARPQQAHRRQAREQHLHQAPRLLARRGDLLRVRAQAHLSEPVGRMTHAATSEVGSFGRSGSLAPTAQSTVESTKWRDP